MKRGEMPQILGNRFFGCKQMKWNKLIAFMDSFLKSVVFVVFPRNSPLSFKLIKDADVTI